MLSLQLEQSLCSSWLLLLLRLLFHWHLRLSPLANAHYELLLLFHTESFVEETLLFVTGPLPPHSDSHASKTWKRLGMVW